MRGPQAGPRGWLQGPAGVEVSKPGLSRQDRREHGGRTSRTGWRGLRGAVGPRASCGGVGWRAGRSCGALRAGVEAQPAGLRPRTGPRGENSFTVSARQDSRVDGIWEREREGSRRWEGLLPAPKPPPAAQKRTVGLAPQMAASARLCSRPSLCQSFSFRACGAGLTAWRDRVWGGLCHPVSSLWVSFLSVLWNWAELMGSLSGGGRRAGLWLEAGAPPWPPGALIFWGGSRWHCLLGPGTWNPLLGH